MKQKTFGYVTDDFENNIKEKKMLGYFAETPLSANLFRLVSAIQKHAGYRGAAPVGDAGDEGSR